MIYTLPDVKKELKGMATITSISIGIEEFGEGYDTHVDVRYRDKYHNQQAESYQVGEEESLKKAEARGKRIHASLEKIYDFAKYSGLYNC